MLSAIVTTPISFEEWLERNPDMKAVSKNIHEDQHCEECNGNGEITCPECEGEGTIECTECGGKGGFAITRNEAANAYAEELAREQRLLERYQACGTLPPIPGG